MPSGTGGSSACQQPGVSSSEWAGPPGAQAVSGRHVLRCGSGAGRGRELTGSLRNSSHLLPQLSCRGCWR